MGSPEGYNYDQSGTVRGKYCCPHYDPTKHTAQFGFDKGPNLMYMWRAINNIIFILSHIAYRKDQFICPVPWTHEELILKWDRETIMKEKDTKKINQTFVT